MCGIFGIIRFDDRPVSEITIQQMHDSLVHRGPDDYGTYIQGSVAIGNLRLSIIDLTSGHQPIANEDGTRQIVYNGELYNFRELHTRLSNHHFTTRSDTEVILHAVEEWGLEALPQFNGMFAIAIWDSVAGTLLIARDRLGIKPLYYVQTSEYFAFASEIKALLNAGLTAREIDPDSFRTSLSIKYVPSENTLFRSVKRLLPGEYMYINLDNYNDGHSRRPRYERGRYWQFKWNIDIPHQRESSYVEELRSLVEVAVRDQLVSDVPIGVFLSGGLDSAIVIKMMSRHLQEPIRAFTIDYTGLASNGQNEATRAHVSASDVGAKHFLTECTARQSLDMLPFLIYHLDEPIMEPLLAPSYLLAKAAREQVTVVLTGEGSDELFGGYSRYKLTLLHRYLSMIPHSLRKKLAIACRQLLGPQDIRSRILNTTLDQFIIHDWYSVFTEPELSALTGKDISVLKWGSGESQTSEDMLQAFLRLESETRLPEFILARVDKMTMAASIESRPPILDNRVVDFALRLPSEYKLHGNRDKYILRRAFEQDLPTEILKRKKIAFSAPYESWLSEATKRYLVHSQLAVDGILQQKEIDRVIKGDRPYRGRTSEKVWGLIVMEVWYRVFINEALPFTQLNYNFGAFDTDGKIR